MSKTVIVVFVTFLLTWTSFAQSKPDKYPFKKLIAQAQPFKPAKAEVAGSPYFLPGWLHGDVMTREGVYVEDLVLKYDTNQDQLVVLCDGDSMILPSSQIKNFSIRDHKKNYEFERVLSTNQEREHYKRGYYQVLYHGRIKLLAKSKKKVKKEQYHCKTRYYLYSHDREMKGIKPQRKQLLNKLRHRKYELERYMDAYDLDPENATHLVKIVAYYDSLI